MSDRELILSDIDEYLARQEHKELLRLLTCGSVDDGKSTLIGRLLHDSKQIYEDQLDALRSDSVRSGTLDGKLDLSLLVDGLQAEREQGITIDVAYRYFSTSKRKFIIADAPGHEQYTRNMATGASNCDLAIILVDARYGVLTQTKRHTFIATLLGIKHIIVAINKMDLVDYSESVYQRIKADYAAFSMKLDVADLRYLPMSALLGDNVVEKSENMAWYHGAPLISMLENIQIASDRNLSDFRMPVQYVNRPNLDFRGYCGSIASGVVARGDEVTVLPSGKTTRVTSIVTYEGEIEEAYPPLAVTLTLEDDIDVSRGDMLVPSNNLTYLSDRLDAHIVWMSEAPMVPGKQYLIKHTTRKTTGSVNNIRFKVDINTLEQEAATALQLNEIGRCEIGLTQPIAFDAYRINRKIGAFIMIDRLSNVTVGAGMIVGMGSARAGDLWDDSARQPLLRASASRVTRAERHARFGQRPKIVLLMGLTGAGKSTIAYALERRLFDMGHAAAVLDGQNLRLGASKDLGFDAASRSENLRRAVEIGRVLMESGMIVVGAFVAPSEEVRQRAREAVGEDLLTVYLDAPLDVCMQRDTRGLYASAREEGLAVPGVTIPFEPPVSPDLVLPTHEIPVSQSVERLIGLLRERGAFDAVD